MPASDAELARAAQSGDAVSLGMLLERHRASLHLHALRMLGLNPEVQDAVQETFLVAVRTIGQLREPDAALGWLHGILRNACLTSLKRGRRQVPLDEIRPSMQSKLVEASVEEAIDQLALKEWVWTALTRLPEGPRATVMLRYFGTYSSYEEIGAILGIPVGTVRSRLHEARSKLGEALLQTAALGQDEIHRARESRARYFAAAYEQYSRGDGYELLLNAFAEDTVLTFPEGSFWSGRQQLARDLEGDLEVGMEARLTNFLSSKEVTVIELAYQNPPDKPSHCPPELTAVGFSSQEDELIHRMRLWFTTPTPDRLLTHEERK